MGLQRQPRHVATAGPLTAVSLCAMLLLLLTAAPISGRSLLDSLQCTATGFPAGATITADCQAAVSPSACPQGSCAAQCSSDPGPSATATFTLRAGSCAEWLAGVANGNIVPSNPGFCTPSNSYCTATWTPSGGATFGTCTFRSSPQVFPTCWTIEFDSTSVTFTGTGAAGCPTVSHVFAECKMPATCVLPTPTATITDVTCFGGNDGKLGVTPSGGTPPYTITVTDSSTYSSTKTVNDAGTDVVFDNLPAGTYTATVANLNDADCKVELTAMISQPETAVALDVSSGTIQCHGGTTTLTATPSGGTPPYTVSCDGTLGSKSDIASGASATFASVPAGTYTCTVKDANGCTASASETIAEPSKLAASATAATPQCGDTSVVVTVSVSGGTSPYTVTSSSGVSPSGTGPFTFLEAVSPGSYTYTATDANACSTTTTVTVTQETCCTVPYGRSPGFFTQSWCTGANACAPQSKAGQLGLCDFNPTYPITLPAACGTYSSVTDRQAACRLFSAFPRSCTGLTTPVCAACGNQLAVKISEQFSASLATAGTKTCAANVPVASMGSFYVCNSGSATTCKGPLGRATADPSCWSIFVALYECGCAWQANRCSATSCTSGGYYLAKNAAACSS